MNEVMNAIVTRRSVRSYKADKLPKEVLDQIMEAGLYAPSAKNQQPCMILCVTNEALLDKMARMNAAVLGALYAVFALLVAALYLCFFMTPVAVCVNENGYAVISPKTQTGLMIELEALLGEENA